MSTPSRIRPVTRGDAPEIIDLLNACDVAEVGEPDSTMEDLQGDWNMEGFDLATDAWVAEGPRGLVGYAYAGDQYRNGELEANLWVHPDQYEAGLAERLLGLAERRATRLAVDRGYGEARLDIFCVRDNPTKRDLLRKHGYEPVRTVYRMSIDLSGDVPVAPAPEGIAIRTFRPGTDERTMFTVMHDAFADHFRQSDEPFEAWKQRLLGHPNFVPELWWLAWDDAAGEAAGGVVAYDHGDLGWLQGLGVRRAWRRRGLGAALLAHAFAAYKERGQLRVDLSVDAEGETRPLRVYERAGMQTTAAYELYAKQLSS